MIGVVLALLMAGTASGATHLILLGSAARELIRQEGGHPHGCERLGLRTIRCHATYWSERHEAEQEPDGSLVNEVVTYESEERSVTVALR